MAEQVATPVTVPQGFVVGFMLFLVAQTFTGIWWASKLDATLQFTVSTFQTQKTDTDSRLDGMAKDLKEQKERMELQNLTIQLLQVKIGVIEGRRK